jgi:hypothetical protein
VQGITIDQKCNVFILHESIKGGFERATVPGLVMDIRDLKFEDASFDIAIDKGNAVFEEENFQGHLCIKVQWMQ